MDCKVIYPQAVTSLVTVFACGDARCGIWPRGIFGPFEEPANGPNENDYNKCKTDQGTNDDTGDRPC